MLLPNDINFVPDYKVSSLVVYFTTLYVDYTTSDGRMIDER
jgi:hypothetical protein